MKYLLPLVLGTILFSCNDQDKTTTITSTEGAYENEVLYMEPIRKINPENSYSDLFVDSMDMGTFINGINGEEVDKTNLKSFYNYRNNEFAWFTSEGLTEQAKGFWNLQSKLGYDVDKSLRNRVDSLLNEDSLQISLSDSFYVQTELQITRAFIPFYKKYRSQTHFVGLPIEAAIPAEKKDPMTWAEEIVMQDVKSDTASQYYKLRQKLVQYLAWAKNGDSMPISRSVSRMKKGTNNTDIAALKKRLQLTGDLTASDTSGIYNDSLTTAIKSYQRQHGLAVTGNLSDSLVSLLNRPAKTVLPTLLINLMRAQWMPLNQEANYISVNVPEFMLRVYEHDSLRMEIPVAVGKEGASTTVFNGMLNEIVFSPYWNIPESIVKEELMPKMKDNPNYLKSKNMEITGKRDSIPIIRQKPGKGNALGQVKFLFPNPYDIYFHDTYEEAVFNKKNRAVSHGCIRLKEPAKLAAYLLRDKSDWTKEKIKAAMNADTDKSVAVKSVPVWIGYYTQWVDESGALRSAEDVYGLDKRVEKKLFL